MKCEAFTTLILEEFWGSLTPGGKKALDEHLRSCPACVKEKERMTELLDEMVLQKGYDPGDAYWGSFNKRVFAKIEERSGRGHSVLALPLRIRLVTAIVLAVTALVLLPFTYRYFLQQKEAPLYEEKLQAAISMASTQETDEIIERVVPFYREDSFYFTDLESLSAFQGSEREREEDAADGFVPYSLLEDLDDSEKEDLLSQIALEMG